VTNPKKVAEEVIFVTGFGRFFNFRDIYSISSLKKVIKLKSEVNSFLVINARSR
jgi:hypothetical protein